MMVDYSGAAAVVIGGATAFAVVVAVIVKWRTLQRESRVKLARFFKLLSIFIVIGLLYFGLFDHTPHGTRCQNSSSPDGLYTAERCLVAWVPGGDSEYVGRVFDAKSGKLLVQRTFSTPVPETLWFDDGGMSFSRGGDSAAFITFPLSAWDWLLTARPHL